MDWGNGSGEGSQLRRSYVRIELMLGTEQKLRQKVFFKV
jgi:hypothetical protein